MERKRDQYANFQKNEGNLLRIEISDTTPDSRPNIVISVKIFFKQIVTMLQDFNWI